LARRLAELILVSSFAESNQLLPSTALLFILVNELTVLQEALLRNPSQAIKTPCLA
jgi:hypothetical protein